MFSNDFFFKCYVYVYRKYYNSSSYTIGGVKKIQFEVKLNNFRKKLSRYYNVGALGEIWAFSYITYQFHRLSQANIMRFTNGQGGGRIIFDDMIRIKSLEMYVETYSNNPHAAYFHLKFNKQHRLIESEILSQDTSLFYEVKRGKRLHDIERKRFLNTDDGLSHCVSQGFSYDKESSICGLCEFKEMCSLLSRERLLKNKI